MSVPGIFARAEEAAGFGEEELKTCMDEFGDMVLRTAYVYLRDRQKAEDVYQEVFVRVFRHGDKIKRMGNAQGWILRVTMNLCRDLKRSTWWRRVLFLNDERDGVSGSLEDRIVASEKSRELLAHIMRLETPYRMAVLLFYYHDLSTREIAGVLKVPEGTVRSRLHRARALLKDYMNSGEESP